MMVLEIMPEQADVVIVGGGLTGLAAAVLLARSGKQVVLFEKSQKPGGRGISQNEKGVIFNLGAHALYRGGPAWETLLELGITPQGKVPALGGILFYDGKQHPFPGSAMKVLTSSLLSTLGKVEFVKLLLAVQKVDTAPLYSTTWGEWADRSIRNPVVRNVLLTLLRLGTYAADAEALSAGAALEQARVGLNGALYLDGGWQTVVDALRNRAVQMRVKIVHEKVLALECEDRVKAAVLDGGRKVRCDHTVLAVAPADAVGLLREREPRSLAAWARRLTPVRVACMDMAFRGLPNPSLPFTLGVDHPLYFSNHSLAARLSENGETVVHLLRYISNSESARPEKLQQELESFLDAIQPGWHNHVVLRRFLPNMTVSHALYTPWGRPEVTVPEVRGLYVAGDWVGKTGMLLDAAFASARQAARQILTQDIRAPLAV